MEQYGGILRAARERANLKQEDLAHLLHINQSDISKYESGAREPTMSLFRSWMNNTNCQDLAVAFIAGSDGVMAMQKMMESISGALMFISTFL